MARTSSVAARDEAGGTLAADSLHADELSGCALFTLITDEAARQRVTAWRIWVWALEALVGGGIALAVLDIRGLLPPLPAALSVLPLQTIALDEKAPNGRSWIDAFADDLAHVRFSKVIPPDFAHRYSAVFVPPDAFRRMSFCSFGQARGRASPGPKSQHGKMQQALAELQARGYCFSTRKRAHDAVLKHLGLKGEPPHGFSYDTFRKATKIGEL